MARPWRSIQPGNDEVPQLLLNARLDDTGYHVQISDLSRVWEEDLSKDAIIKRASEIGCSIDVTENDQYQILLEKIQSAFDGEDETMLNLRQHTNEYDLELDVTAPLPAPLPLFRWTLQLSRLDAWAIGVNIVTPLLQQAKALHDQIEQLVSELKAKDHVISKVTDELEKASHDLAQAFPATTGRKTNRRSSQREQLGRYVAGLAEFDRKSILQDEYARIVSPATLDIAIGKSKVAYAHDSNGEWWRSLNASGPSGDSGGPGHSEQRTKGCRNVEVTIEEEKDVQANSRESTPSTKDGDSDDDTEDRPPKPRNLTDKEERSLEDDDDDFAAETSHNSSQTKGRSQEEKTSTASSPHRKTSPASLQATAKLKLGVFRARDKSSVAELHGAEGAQADSSTSKAKLGSFAGKRGKVTTDAAHGNDASKSRPKLGTFSSSKATKGAACVTTSVQPESPNRPKHKIGMFKGGRNMHESAKLEEGEIGATVSSSNQSDAELSAHHHHTAEGTHVTGSGEDSAPTGEREKSEEPPEQKRERLKRELQEKSKAPVKKKRKF